MGCLPKQYWYVEGGTKLNTMRYLVIPGGRRCSIIKVFINIENFTQYGIDYSGK